MKIVDVKTFVVGNPWKNWVFVKVYTDEGVVGLGEATQGLATKPAEAAVHEMKPLYLGRDPRDVAAVFDRMYKGIYLTQNSAITAIECACWDILGKSLGVPVWRLLGGKMRSRVRAYANGWYQGPRDPAFFAERAKEVAEMGYTALKFDPFGSAYRYLDRDEERLSLDIVRAVRQAVGEQVDLLIEAHDRLSASTAVRVGRALAEFRPMWIETPVMSTDVRATIEVARQIPIPVASGERFGRKREFADLLESGAVDIVQPELLRVGGVLELRKVAAVAEAYEASVAPHNAQSPYTTVVNTHVDATIPNVLIQECFDDFLVPWSRDVLTGWASVRDGYIEVPDAPGFGVELVEAEAAKYPYADRNFLRLFESGWERRRGEEEQA